MNKTRTLSCARMDDLAKKAIRTGYAASKFLTPAEAEEVKSSLRRDVILTFDGGFDGAERVRAIFTNPDWGKYENSKRETRAANFHQEFVRSANDEKCERDEIVAALKISHRPQDKLGHRDILGALMALGIERDVIGDILIGKHFATLVCLPEISKYIAENLTKAGRVGLTVSEIPICELPAREENLTIKTDTVASLRLDAVLCAAFGLSRAKAAELISAGRVNLNHQNCLRPDKDVGENALISVRGLGRARLLEVGGVSKKGRNFVKIGI
ncbi:MAG: YlmH/Sll1252 family protein [Defluviitaleaceae bacterium]|nr:YlmH/Sll1252 family protein [Defluviitaleaceae bacterium]